jgi:hypothetical protein
MIGPVDSQVASIKQRRLAVGQRWRKVSFLAEPTPDLVDGTAHKDAISICVTM